MVVRILHGLFGALAGAVLFGASGVTITTVLLALMNLSLSQSARTDSLFQIWMILVVAPVLGAAAGFTWGWRAAGRIDAPLSHTLGRLIFCGVVFIVSAYAGGHITALLLDAAVRLLTPTETVDMAAKFIIVPLGVIVSCVWGWKLSWKASRDFFQ
ncbi:MAG: hypothetical protein ACK5JT_08265 [Hyphomicrobiaceae bacterium]